MLTFNVYDRVFFVRGDRYGTYNTGFLVAYGINHALDVIRRNPIGLPVLDAI